MIDLTDPTENIQHYSQANGREPGWQISHHVPLDQRQQLVGRYILYGGLHTATDLGCADGSLLIGLMQSRIIQRGYGCDLWHDGVAWGQGYINTNHLDIQLVEMSVYDYQGPTTDVTVLGEILEHLTDPIQALRVAARQSSTVIITVPISRPPLTDEERSRLLVTPEEHINTYDSVTLRAQCATAGLRVDREEMIGTGWVNLVALARRI